MQNCGAVVPQVGLLLFGEPTYPMLGGKAAFAAAEVSAVINPTPSLTSSPAIGAAMATTQLSSTFQKPLNKGAWRRNMSFQILAAILLAVAWLADATVFGACNPWYNGAKPLNGEFHQIILSLAMFGQGLGMVLSVLLVRIFDPDRSRTFAIIGVLLVAGLASSVGKLAFGRERPLQSQGETIFHGTSLSIRPSRLLSFPSGHMTTSTALAACLSHFYPQARVLFWTLAAGVGVNRVITVVHFPSDVVAGFWLGWMVAGAMLRFVNWHQVAAWFSTFESHFKPMNFNLVWWWARRGWRSSLSSPWLLFAVSLSIHWLGNHATPLWDRDEPRFATASREMLLRNDWIVPTFNGDLRPDKPILVYWLMMFSYSVFGVNTFAARCFSGIAGTIAVAATYGLGRRMFDARVGLVAGWILALSPMLVIESKLATADALLLCWLTLAASLMWRLASPVDGKSKLWEVVAFWLMVSLAILTKGPVAVGVLGATAVLFAVVAHDFGWLRTGLRPILGAAIIFAVTMPWCWAVQVATDGEFLRQALGRHVVERSFTAMENHRGFPGYYLVSVFLLMAPWGWALPWTAVTLGRRCLVDRRLAFIIAWIVGPLLMFEAVRTKLVHYYLPAYPAMALFLSAGWVGRFPGLPTGSQRIDFRLGWATFWSGLLLASSVAVAGCILYPQWLAAPGVFSVGLLGVGIVAAGLSIARGLPQVGFRSLAACMATSLAIASSTFLPRLGQSRPILEVARRLDHHRHERIAFWMYRDPSLIFNLNGVYPVVDPMRLEPDFPDTRRHAAEGPFVCPMTPDQYATMQNDTELSLRILESVKRWDGSTLRERTVHLVVVSRKNTPVADRSAASQGKTNNLR